MGSLRTRSPPTCCAGLFTMAQPTASWRNSQAWQVHLLSGGIWSRSAPTFSCGWEEGPEVPDIPAPERFEGVYAQRRRACGKAPYDAMRVARVDRAGRVRQMLEKFRFFCARHHAIVTSPSALGTYDALDCRA